MEQKTEVELIPWKHNIEQLNHLQVIDYIKKMPKNASLALEISQKEIDLLKRLFRLIADGKVEKERLNRQEVRYVIEHKNGQETIRLDNLNMAFIEVVIEAKKRNITIIPIQTMAKNIYNNQIPWLMGEDWPTLKHRTVMEAIADEMAWLAKKNIFNEKIMARQIYLTLKKFKQNKLVVLTGHKHTEPLKKGLENLNIVSKINSGITQEDKELIIGDPLEEFYTRTGIEEYLKQKEIIQTARTKKRLGKNRLKARRFLH